MGKPSVVLFNTRRLPPIKQGLRKISKNPGRKNPGVSVKNLDKGYMPKASSLGRLRMQPTTALPRRPKIPRAISISGSRRASPKNATGMISGATVNCSSSPGLARRRGKVQANRGRGGLGAAAAVDQHDHHDGSLRQAGGARLRGGRPPMPSWYSPGCCRGSSSPMPWPMPDKAW